MVSMGASSSNNASTHISSMENPKEISSGRLLCLLVIHLPFGFGGGGCHGHSQIRQDKTVPPCCSEGSSHSSAASIRRVYSAEYSVVEVDVCVGCETRPRGELVADLILQADASFLVYALGWYERFHFLDSMT